jgi:hypothetical protein
MTLDEFLKKIRAKSESITLDEALGVIGKLYDFVPVSFLNGWFALRGGSKRPLMSDSCLWNN